MRRALLVGLGLLAPALAARADSITFTPDALVGKSGCISTSTERITLNATPVGPSSSTPSLTGGVYRLFATKTATTTSNNLTQCASDAVEFSTADIASSGSATQSFAVDTRDILVAAGFTCDETSTTKVYVCAHYFASANDASPSAAATGVLTYSVVKPAKPVISSVEPGEASLFVSWGDVTDASYYIITASANANSPVADPNPHATGHVTSTSRQTITGLTNGVLYDVKVTAYSDADTASDPSEASTGTPGPVDDFWERYHNAQGQEQGGCASGPAGLLGMLLAAAGLSRLRRRS